MHFSVCVALCCTHFFIFKEGRQKTSPKTIRFMEVNNIMEEKTLIKGKFYKFNPMSAVFIMVAIITFIYMVRDYNGNFKDGVWTGSSIYYPTLITYFTKNWVTVYCLGWYIVFWAAVFFAVLCFFIFNRCEITVTDKRVFGKINFGLRTDLPPDKISYVESGLFKSLMVATSSSKMFFWLLKNKEEVHSCINDLLIQRQTNTNSVFVQTTHGDVTEIKKYKELLDSGIITQEEFDQKKKQLLGL